MSGSEQMHGVVGLTFDQADSPTPPAINEQMRMADGKWLFSAEEKTFTLKYAHLLIARDITITNSSIASKLHQKVRSFIPPAAILSKFAG
jgi:hypothetical protein